MSYRDYHPSFRQRAASGAAVIALQAAVAAVLVTGLTIAVVKPEPKTPFEGYTEVPLPPPPPDPSPAPRAEAPARNPVAPAPPIPLPPAPGPTVDEFDPAAPPSGYFPAPPIPAPAPASLPQPSPSFAPKRPVPVGNPGGWISTEDYPSAALRRGVEGQVAYRLVVASSGKVSACELTRSSGNAQLDTATCRLLERRARFSPATDHTGATVVGTYTGTVRWEIPD